MDEFVTIFGRMHCEALAGTDFFGSSVDPANHLALISSSETLETLTLGDAGSHWLPLTPTGFPQASHRGLYCPTGALRPGTLNAGRGASSFPLPLALLWPGMANPARVANLSGLEYRSIPFPYPISVLTTFMFIPLCRVFSPRDKPQSMTARLSQAPSRAEPERLSSIGSTPRNSHIASVHPQVALAPQFPPPSLR